MRWQPAKLMLLVGVCSVGLAGCANLRLAGNGGTFGFPVAGGTASPSVNSDPGSQFGLSSAAAGAEPSATPAQAQERMRDSQLALARLCERRGENDQAKQIYNVLLEKTPKDARLHHRLGVVAVQESNFARAEECFRTAQSLAPPTAELLSDMGYCCYLQHRLPEAESALNEALKLEPAHAAAVNNLALVLGRQGRFQESLDLFKRNNSEAEAYANLAYVLAQNGQLAQAEQMYLRALTLDNRMRAAAQAILQIKERQQTQTELASAGFGPAPTAASASDPSRGPQQVVPLPRVVEEGPGAAAPPAATRPQTFGTFNDANNRPS